MHLGAEGQGLVFLLGVPRSGTTLLATMLGRHPAIVAPPEPWLMLALSELGRVSARHPADSKLLGAAVGEFLGHEGLIAAARSAAHTVYQTYVERSGASLFVDKTPRYVFILDFIAAVFPHARYIWLRRDPMDIAASYLTTWRADIAKMFARQADAPETFDLTIGFDRLVDFHRRHADLIHVVHYENLVRWPRQELLRLLPHLGLAPTESAVETMIAITGTERAKGTFGDTKIHATSRVHANSIGAWRSVLDAGQLQILLDAIGPSRMFELGYAATVGALKQNGIVQRDPARVSNYRLMARRHHLAREADIRQSTTLNLDPSAARKTARQRLRELAQRWSRKLRILARRPGAAM
jgi:O-antigen biosynthesis protein